MTAREAATTLRGRAWVPLWLALTVSGAVVVALPDAGPRLVTFSAAHGPGALDAVGISILLAGLAVFVAGVWPRRHALALRAGPGVPASAVFAAGAGAGLVIASVAGDWPHWWLVGAGLLALVQAAAAVVVLRAERAA